MSAQAVVRICDVQFHVRPDLVLRVPKLDASAGDIVTFDEVLLISGKNPKIGMPLVAGAKVTAEVLQHGRGDKVITFKYKRRKGFRKTIGHRQGYTALRIKQIEG